MDVIRHLAIDEITPHQVGPGCVSRGLPAIGAVSAWVVDMEPGSQWPRVDKHDELGEHVYVVSGELIEGSTRYGAGSYLLYGPNSEHQPRTEIGVRLLGFNLLASGDA